jgi:hypothetical protein
MAENMKLNSYRMREAFKKKDAGEIRRIMADEWGNQQIESLELRTGTGRGQVIGYADCYIGGFVYEWYPDDGFTARLRDDTYVSDHIYVVFPRDRWD